MSKKKTLDPCTVCGGWVVHKRVEKICAWGGHIIAIAKNVPADVCEQCGERYYDAHVIEEIDARLGTLKNNAKRIEVPVLEYAA